MIVKSCLIVSANRKLRSHIADTLRASGIVIVEAMTVAQAQAILKQLRFDAVAFEPDGLGVQPSQSLHDFRVDHPETQIFFIEPVNDNGIVARLKDIEVSMRSGAIELTRATEQAADRLQRNAGIVPRTKGLDERNPYATRSRK